MKKTGIVMKKTLLFLEAMKKNFKIMKKTGIVMKKTLTL